MTVDWTNWMILAPQEQAALWREYRAIIKAESDALVANPSRLNAALAGRRA